MVFVIPVAATIVGATVSSAVYTSINTTGEISASLISRGIGLASNVVGAGADYLFGAAAGNSIRVMGAVGETFAAPVISNSTRTLAVGSSIVAGTAAALLATGAVSGVKAIVNLSTNIYHKYMPTNKTPNGVLLLEDGCVETPIAKKEIGVTNATLTIMQPTVLEPIAEESKNTDAETKEETVA
jgi:hypothetical protein